MSRLLSLLVVLLLAGCVKQGEVAALSLRDPHIPIEARRWLADAEDEVAIAEAMLDDARADLAEQRAYGQEYLARVRRVTAGAEVEGARELPGLFAELADQREELARLRVSAGRVRLDYSRARLTLVRAETAVRHDLGVYEIEPLVAEVERTRSALAAAEAAVEDQRAQLERVADAAWLRFTAYAAAGGPTEDLWGGSQP